MRRALLGLLALALPLAATPARAEFAQFLAATCGTPCADPIGEQAAARDNWSALQAMGTTRWIGSTIGGTRVDASSLLGTARMVGATELDRWLTTGEASSAEAAQFMSDGLRGYAGLDVALVTGAQNYDPTTAAAYGQRSDLDGYSYGSTGYGSSSSSLGSVASGLATQIGSGLAGGLGGGAASLASSFGGAGTASLAGALAGGMGGAGGAGGYCDGSIEAAQNANAQRYVNAMQQIATSGQYGFTQNGGQPILSGARSGSGYYGGGCLEQLMTGTRDTLFRPPQLSGLLSQLGGMFGGSGSGGCAAAPSVMSQITQSMPGAIFRSGNGGFMPSTAFGGPGLSLGSGLAGLGQSQMGAMRGITSLLGR